MDISRRDRKKIFLNCAQRIGTRICEQAEWTNTACTWKVNRIDRKFQRPDRHIVKDRAGGTVYRGTAGIALFLGELYRYTRDAVYKKTADGAMAHALKEAERLSSSNFGFHSGRVGIAWVAVRLADCLDRPDYLPEAERVFEPLIGNESEDRGIDVIAGAAGAIPALLQMSEELPHKLTVDVAVNLGEHLIHVAHKEPVGWSWNTIRSAAARHLCGLAHGASGIGHAFFELYHATGATQYLYAAEQAFLYERQFLSEEEGDWPDFRYAELSQYLYHDRIEELRAAIRAGDLAPYELKYMSAWCHGAPGIGLTRLRAYELLENPVYLAEGEHAIKATQRSLNRAGGNYSLCHGRAGNAETLLYASNVLQDDALRERAEACALQGWKKYEEAKQPWPGGTTGAPADAGLMLGEAGIGYFYLRLHSDTVPSILQLRTPKNVRALPGRIYRSMQAEHVQVWFGRTLRVLNVLNLNIHNHLWTRYSERAQRVEESSELEVKVESEVTTTYKKIQTLIAQVKEPQKNFLQDAFYPEQVRYEITLEQTDFTQEFLDDLQRQPVEGVDWADATISLAEHVRIVLCRCNWDEWLRQSTDERPALPEASDTYFLIYRKNNRMHERRLGPFAALVLRELAQPVRMAVIVAHMANLLDVPFERAALHAAIVEQLEQAYQAGLLIYHFLEDAVTDAPSEEHSAFV